MSAPAFASVRLDLEDDWRFRTDPASRISAYDPAARAPQADWLAAGRRVQVPNTWAIGPDQAFEGVGWYSRSLVLPAALAAQHVELNFGATFSVSRVWVNGIKVGGHVGGFTSYALDISHAVRVGENRIVVAIDNRPGLATLPGYALRLKASGSVAYDWKANGGIVRPVWLSISSNALIRRQRLTSVIAPDQATVTDRVTVQNLTAAPAEYRLIATAVDPDGLTVARAETLLHLAANAVSDGRIDLLIPKPRLWNIAAAQLYTIKAKVQDAQGRALDSVSDAYGLRTLEIRDRRLFVNGQPVRLTGVTRHEDSPWEGLAETRGTIQADWHDLAALHVTLTRPVHYPQPPEVLDAADRAGILLIPEIPVWQMSEAQLKDPRLIAAAEQMMTEMIDQAANHPSILAWSVCNESDASTPGGEAYVRALKALINRLDPGRFVTFADSDISAKPWRREAVMDQADFIMANAYFGSWSGAAADVGPWLDYMDKTYPTKMLVISEFGWPGPFSKDSAMADQDRIANFTGQLTAFARAPFVGGAIFWTYQDYRSTRNLWPGETDGYVDHGLVDQNRQRRPSYAAWEELNRAVAVSPSWSFGPDGPSGFVATVTPKALGALPAYPLIGYSLGWRVVSAGGVVLAKGEAPLDLSKPISFSRDIAGSSAQGATLTLDVLTATGVRAGGAKLDYRPLRFGFTPYPADPAQLPETRP